MEYFEFFMFSCHFDFCLVLLTSVESFWVMLSPAVSYWVLESHVDYYRVLLNHLESCWVLLGTVESCRFLLSPAETCWVLFSHVGSCWVLLSSVESCWVILWIFESCWVILRLLNPTDIGSAWGPYKSLIDSNWTPIRVHESLVVFMIFHKCIPFYKSISTFWLTSSLIPLLEPAAFQPRPNGV